MKTFVLIVSETFPKGHSKGGQPTGFPLAIKQYVKIHTIRKNYPLWRDRIEKVNKGQAVLSVRVWTGTPYQSIQREIFRYDQTHGIGVEKLEFDALGMKINDVDFKMMYGPELIAANDGLKLPDFNEWFTKSKLENKPLAIIHFTDYRYTVR